MFFTYILFTSEEKKNPTTSTEEVKITKSKKIKMETKKYLPRGNTLQIKINKILFAFMYS